MMLMPDRKKAITLILGGMKPDFVQRMDDKSEHGVKMQEEVEDDYSLAFKDAATKIISALEKKDVDSFVDYMKEFFYMCQQSESNESSEDYNPMS